MKDSRKDVGRIFGTLLVMSVAGCAATPVPQDLLDARSSYQRAQSGTMQYNLHQVYEAKLALDKAEQSYRDDPGDQKTRDLAYVARRKAER